MSNYNTRSKRGSLQGLDKQQDNIALNKQPQNEHNQQDLEKMSRRRNSAYNNINMKDFLGAQDQAIQTQSSQSSQRLLNTQVSGNDQTEYGLPQEYAQNTTNASKSKYLSDSSKKELLESLKNKRQCRTAIQQKITQDDKGTEIKRLNNQGKNTSGNKSILSEQYKFDPQLQHQASNDSRDKQQQDNTSRAQQDVNYPDQTNSNFQLLWFQEQFKKLSYNEIMQVVGQSQELSSVIGGLRSTQQQPEMLDAISFDFQKNNRQRTKRQYSNTQQENRIQDKDQILGMFSHIENYPHSNEERTSSPIHDTSPTGSSMGSAVFRAQKYGNNQNTGLNNDMDLVKSPQTNINVTMTSNRYSIQEENVMKLWNQQWTNNPIQWTFSAMQIIYSFIPTLQQLWASDSLEQAIQLQTQNRLLGLTKQTKLVLLWEDVQLSTKIFVVGLYLVLLITQLMQGTQLIRPFTTLSLILFMALIANFIFVVRIKADNLRTKNHRQVKETVRTRNTALILRVQSISIHLLAKLASYIIPVTVALVTLFVKELYSGSLTPTMAFAGYLWLLACISEARILSQSSLIVFLYLSAFCLPCGYAKFKTRIDQGANMIVKVTVDYLDPKYRAAHISAFVVGLVAMMGLGIKGLVLKTTVGFSAGIMFLFWRICVINKDIQIPQVGKSNSKGDQKANNEVCKSLLLTKASVDEPLSVNNKQANILSGNIYNNKIEITDIGSSPRKKVN